MQIYYQRIRDDPKWVLLSDTSKDTDLCFRSAVVAGGSTACASSDGETIKLKSSSERVLFLRGENLRVRINFLTGERSFSDAWE